MRTRHINSRQRTPSAKKEKGWPSVSPSSYIIYVPIMLPRVGIKERTMKTLPFPVLRFCDLVLSANQTL